MLLTGVTNVELKKAERLKWKGQRWTILTYGTLKYNNIDKIKGALWSTRCNAWAFCLQHWWPMSILFDLNGFFDMDIKILVKMLVFFTIYSLTRKATSLTAGRICASRSVATTGDHGRRNLVIVVIFKTTKWYHSASVCYKARGIF